MSSTRRDFLQLSAGAASALTLLPLGLDDGVHAAPGNGIAQASGSAMTFPRKGDFNIADGYTYISGAYTHPMPMAAAEAYHQAVTRRSTLAPAAPRPAGATANTGIARDPKAAFATLINAKPSEICYVPNTSTGENLVVEGLGIGNSMATSSPTSCTSRARSCICSS